MEEVVAGKEEAKVEAVVTPEVKEAPALTEVEQQAYKEGWRPQNEYKDAAEKAWIPADEFIRRKPLFEKIDSLKSDAYQTRRELQEVRKTLTTLADHHKKVRETEYQRAIDDLKGQRRAAMDDRDIKAVEHIEERMDEVKAEKQDFDRQVKEEVKANVGPTEEFVSWVKDNGWYHTNKEMHDFADDVGAAYLRRNPQSSPNDVFVYVSKQAKRAFPETLGNGNGVEEPKRKPSPVDSSTSEGRSSSSGKDDYKLSSEELEVAKRFEASGVMTRKQYAEELRKFDKRS